MSLSGQKRSILREVLRRGRPHRTLWMRAFASMALLGATTGAYAFLMGPTLQFLLTGGTRGLELAGRLVPALTQLDRARVLWIFPLLLVAIGVLKAIGYLGQFYFMGLFGQRVAMDLRREVFGKLTTLSPAQRSKLLTGDLLSRFSLDVGAIEQAATQTLGSYVRDGLQIIILVAVALFLDWKLALISLCVVPVAVVPVARLTRSVLRRTREGQTRLGALAGQVQEGLGGIRTIQAYNGQAAELMRFDAHADAHRKSMVRAGWTRGAVPGLMEILAAGAIAAVMAYAATSKVVSPEILVSFLTTLVLLYQPAKDLGRVSQYAVPAAVAAERIFALLDVTPAVADVPDARALPRLREGVKFDKVSYAYGEREALAELNLELPVGQVVALVGPSGGGKSTVTSLLLRFDRPANGTIQIDGVDVASATVKSVRDQFALVSQEPLLFSATILTNIRVGRPDATRAEVEKAAKVAFAADFIEALPQGYDTPVGERGVMLSGGQKQRLCLARAILSNAPVLVLDEATSSLDPESEREVQQALASVLPGRTALVIAHRLSTIVSADRIHVLEKGRVVEHGTHADLLARGGVYAGLWALQNAQVRSTSAAG